MRPEEDATPKESAGDSNKKSLEKEKVGTFAFGLGNSVEDDSQDWKPSKESDEGHCMKKHPDEVTLVANLLRFSLAVTECIVPMKLDRIVDRGKLVAVGRKQTFCVRERRSTALQANAR